MYRGIGDEDALQFFHVDPDTGKITIKKMLYPGTNTQYTVSLTAK